MLLANQSDSGTNAGTDRSHIRMTGMSFEAVDRYKDAVYRTALTVTGNFADAEDIMQDVFLAYFQSHPRFESASHEKAWLLRCTINASKNLLRSAWNRRRSDMDITEISGAEQNEEGSEVLAAVMKLPERYRTAIYLHYYENYSVREISKITGRSEAAVGQHLSRGRAKLRKVLGGEKS